MKKGTILKIIGGFFIFCGLLGLLSGEPLAAIFLLLFGTSLLPEVQNKVKLFSSKTAKILIPVILFLGFACSIQGNSPENTNTANSTNNTNDVNIATNTVSNAISTSTDNIVKLERLVFDETTIEMDIQETKDILLKVTPANADIKNLNFNSTNLNIAKIEQDTEKSTQNEIYAKIQPVSEGVCELYVTSDNIESNKISITVIDNARIERERIAAEEKAKQEEAERQAAEQAKKQAAAQQTQKQTSTAPSKNASSSSTTSSTSNNRTVYITPTGSKYHYSSTCGGKNSRSTTLDSAKSSGYEPCKKCAH